MCFPIFRSGIPSGHQNGQRNKSPCIHLWLLFPTCSKFTSIFTSQVKWQPSPRGATWVSHLFWSPLLVPCDCAVAKACSSAPESLMASNNLGPSADGCATQLQRSEEIFAKLPPHLIPIPVIRIHMI